MKLDEIHFNISQAAKMIGVVPATLRNWERQSLIHARRTANGYRFFTASDIDRLREIHALSAQGISLSAISQITPSQQEHDSSHAATKVSRTLLGKRWKRRRKELGLSIQEAADQVGLSISYLHRIENGKAANVSFEILEKIAGFYGENILSYFEDTSEHSPLIKKTDETNIPINLSGVLLHSTTSATENLLTGMVFTIAPGAGRAKASSHDGEELVYLVSGTVSFFLGDETYEMVSGDSIHFKSHIKHAWKNTGADVATLFWVHTRTDARFIEAVLKEQKPSFVSGMREKSQKEKG